ncbi:MAG: DUF2071 domain-containing protein [Planctomycetota bacterium]
MPWAMFMRWEDLLFAHWPVKPDALRPLIPSGLELDTFDGDAWLGVVPFRMSGIRGRCAPQVPRAHAFAELNLRTYVKTGGKPGVWFFSLDAEHRLAVRVARLTFGLPYFDATMSCKPDGDGITYHSRRTHRDAEPAEYRGRYRPTGPAYRTRPGDLDHWLTERYCLYAAKPGGRVRRGDIHHAPWPIQTAEAEFEVNAMTQQIGVTLPDTPPLLHFARSIEVVAWLPTAKLGATDEQAQGQSARRPITNG